MTFFWMHFKMMFIFNFFVFSFFLIGVYNICSRHDIDEILLKLVLNTNQSNNLFLNANIKFLRDCRSFDSMVISFTSI